MPLRSKKGWLTVVALRAGEREQYAVDRSYGRVIVELLYDPINDPDVLEMPFVTSIHGSGVAEPRSYRSFNAAAARKKFTQLRKQHP